MYLLRVLNRMKTYLNSLYKFLVIVGSFREVKFEIWVVEIGGKRLSLEFQRYRRKRPIRDVKTNLNVDWSLHHN